MKKEQVLNFKKLIIMQEKNFINELISQLNQKIIQDCLFHEIMDKKQEQCDLYKHYYELSVERERKYSSMIDTWNEQCKLRNNIIGQYKDMLDGSHKREDKYHEELTSFKIKVINLYKVSLWHRLCFLFNPFHITNTLLDKINKDVLAEFYENKVQD